MSKDNTMTWKNSTMVRREKGFCSMRGSCGKKGIFGQNLPCPDNGKADTADKDIKQALREVCGPAWEIPDKVCCTADQVETLRSSLQQAEPLLSSCPACRNNFRSYHCTFTCSPDQSLFLDVISTQTTDSKVEAVKEVDYWVDEKLKRGFFDSCKSVQFGATNGYAMDLIGGGAKTPDAFLRYMGDYRPGLGSPFQISIPETSSGSSSAIPDDISPLSYRPLNCSDNGLDSRCTCVDCPEVCASLPYVAPPRPPNDPRCTVGSVSCLTFSLLIIYAVLILFGLSAYSWKLSLRHRQKRYERVAMTDPPLTSPTQASGANPFSHHVSSSREDYSADANGLESEDRQPTPGNGEVNSTAPSGSSRFRLGRGASLLDPIEQLQPRRSQINLVLRSFFYRVGWTCASSPALTFAVAAICVAVLNIGWKFFQVETNPVRLWVSPTSEAASQKAYFDEHFGPFYRAEQIFIMGMPSKNALDGEQIESSTVLPPPTNVLSYDTLDWWLSHEAEIAKLRSEPNGYTLQDVCFSPAGPGTPCVVQSISAWLGTDMSNYDREGEYGWQARVEDCAASPAECLPDFGQPIDPKIILGGAKGEWMDTKSLVVTYVVANSLDKTKVDKAAEWERTLQKYLSELQAKSKDEANVQIAYSTEISLEAELNKSTNTDVRIVVASYLVMFLYVSLTLGGGVSPELFLGENGVLAGLRELFARTLVLLRIRKTSESDPTSARNGTPPPKRQYMASLASTLLSVKSKSLLGLFGICIVLIAVSSAVGMFSWVGVRVTLIIAEVIPFLVLAVGVDNVFILVHELDRQNSIHGPGVKSARGPSTAYDDSLEDDMETPSHLPAEERVARTLARMGPSILLSSTTEIVAFGLGALVPMPAVRNFALYAAGSVMLGAILQVTVFVSAMTLDLRRAESFRMDCLPCIRLRPPVGLYDVDPDAVSNTGESLMTRFMRRVYAPFLLRREVKQLVIVLFGGLFITAVVGMQRITMGLDQRLALPSDSYLVDYFDALDAYLDIGPPVYFVTRKVDVTSRQGQQQMCGRFTTCMELSVANSLEAERKRPESSFIANAPAPWIDDFLHWTDPALDTCCRVRKDDPTVFCSARDSERLCKPCFIDREPEWDITMQGLPEGPEVMRYIQQWLITPTDDQCPLGGLAPYSSAVSLAPDNSSVVASHFRTFHTPLKTQDDFINALAAAKRVASDIHARTGVETYPYSLFYVFFEQYAYITSMTIEVLFLALVAVMAITTVLLGSWRTGATVTVVCLSAVLNVMGVMGFWHISLNAISLVNLVISLGIAVEFCSHIARAFMGAGQGLPYDHPSGGKERDERAQAALVDVGPAVFSGITMTKLIGISVLALTRSKLLEVYYFRMWLALIVSGALHGLILLPVALSYTGGPGYALEDSDEDWVTSAMRRPIDYEYSPFHDADSILSD